MKGRLLLFVFGLVFFSTQAYAQRSISGKVSNGSGVGLSGVSVQEKGKSNQAATNASGTYTIKVSDGAVLIFRSVGFTTIEMKIGNDNVLNVTMKDDESSIDEVVVTAFGIDRDRKSLGYSVPKVDGDEVAATQRAEFFNGLQGRVPGLMVNGTSGLPGASAQIVLRGFVSVSGDNNALIVVDGVPVNNSTMNESDLATGPNNAGEMTNTTMDYSNRGIDLNPEDIESYVIMKGAEATALYGSQGAGGAILITTKKGRQGRTSVNYSYAGRLQYVDKFPERQYIYSNGVNGIYNGTSTYAEGPMYPEGTFLYTDNIKNFFRTGYTNKHNIGAEGGAGPLSFRWSAEYNDNTGVVPNTRYKRLQTSLNNSVDIAPNLKLNTTFNYMDSQNDKTRRGQSSFMYTLLRFNPLYDVRDWIDMFGNRVLNSGSIYSELDNPFWDVYRNTSFDNVNRTRATANLTYTPLKWLTLNGVFGVDYATTHGEQVYHAQSYKGSGTSADDADADAGEITQYDQRARVMNGQFSARGRFKFGEDFSLNAVVASTFDSYQTRTHSQYGRKFADPDFYSINVTDPEERKAKQSMTETRNVGILGQAVFGYKTLLYLTGTLRVDGSSRLMPNKPWFSYPSGSIAFNFTDLDFMKDQKFISDGKLRASVSMTGKQPFLPYQTLSKYTGQTSTGAGMAYDVNGANSTLKPETTIDKEAGIEFSLFKNFLTFDFTYYTRVSKNQIFRPRTSYATGYILKMMNGGTVESQGIEIQAKLNPIKKPDFNWNLTFNFTQNKGKVISLAKELPETYDSDTWIFGGMRSGAAPGYSIGNLMATDYKRNNDGLVLINPETGLPVIGRDDYLPVGNRIPDYTLGTINSLRYKNTSLTFLWDLRVGGDVVNGLEYNMVRLGLSKKTLNREQPRVIEGVWEDGLENTANPTLNNIAVTPYYNYLYYTSFLSRSFIEKDIWTFRLRDITLSQQLPKSWITKFGKNTTMSVFFTATDVFLFTNYSGFDPETNSNTPGIGGVGGFGIDGGGMGKPRGYNFGLRLKL
ncbi:SusC/RagA family TonB-linked outer membrane protein [Sphingobacterium tabacisoli]|uniref:SusC/RagA family TonB-linked outer membrane protein n=1 Tax=Sphingobacterium tabacisoli TaxID=2044855 RepID=A0ABW5KZM3_9SPHI|nr:SusC/RagA family TonB-linked outer membrane protein [Sphingobacterium tabacisoli]